MTRVFTILFICSAAWRIDAQSPITLSNSNMPGNGDTLRFTDVDVSSLGNYTATGTNFKWNFSKVVSAGEGVRDFKSAIQTPYAFFFFGSNEYGEKIEDSLGAGPLVITNYYNFYRKTSTPVSAFVADGVGITFSSIPVPSYYSDRDELYIFPLTYPKYDSTTFRFSTPTTTLLPIRYSKAGYRVTKVDGWGTVTTPYGTENCLRLVTTQYARDTIRNSFIPIPFGFPNFVRSYQWLTLNAKIPFFEVSGSLVGTNFTPSQARYRGYDALMNPTGPGEQMLQNTRFYPNPVKDRIWLSAPGKAGTVSITDPMGRLVLNADLLPGEDGLDVSGLSPGIYFLCTGDGGFARFVKE
jgi:hypothetical protein